MKGIPPTRQPAREGRYRIRPETEIENRHRKVVGLAPHHRIVKGAAHIDDNRASLDESGLEIHRQQQIVFNDEYRQTVQRTVVVHHSWSLRSLTALSPSIRVEAQRPPRAHVPLRKDAA